MTDMRMFGVGSLSAVIWACIAVCAPLQSQDEKDRSDEFLNSIGPIQELKKP